MNNKRNILFAITIVLAMLFLACPIILRIPCVENFITWFLYPLNESGYKSSYFETVGNIIGTILAITGTLLLQGMIDRKADEEKILKEKNDIRYRVIIVYYDLKLAFEDISHMYSLLVVSAFLVDREKIDSFYNSASKIELYVDENWIRNVASLHEILDERTLEEIFLCYGDICSIRSAFKSDNKDMYRIVRLCNLISQFFDGIKDGEPQLKSSYQNLLENLKQKGNIEKEKTENDIEGE